MAQWWSDWLETEGPWVPASLASLRCGPWAGHIYSSLVLVQPRKTRPCLTERLLMGRKESNQTNRTKYRLTLMTHKGWCVVKHQTNKQMIRQNIWRLWMPKINIQKTYMSLLCVDSSIWYLRNGYGKISNWIYLVILSYLRTGSCTSIKRVIL